jgi:hypothetical protein
VSTNELLSRKTTRVKSLPPIATRLRTSSGQEQRSLNGGNKTWDALLAGTTVVVVVGDVTTNMGLVHSEPAFKLAAFKLGLVWYSRKVVFQARVKSVVAPESGAWINVVIPCLKGGTEADGRDF